jgi:RNA polymerase sigma-54 factor
MGEQVMMRLEQSQRLDINQSLQQRLAPRMIQSMEILQLPVLALQERIEQELEENPVLELLEAGAEDTPVDEDPVVPDEVPDPDGELVIDEHSELDFNRLDALSKDYEEAFNEEHRPSRNGIDEEVDRKHDAMQNMPSRPQSLNDYLTEQMTFLDLTPEQFDQVSFLISHLDERGYLLVGLRDLAMSYGQPVTVEELEDSLGLLQKLDPPGVGARDIKECLLLQITPETPHRDAVRVLIINHWEDIAHNRLPVIQRRTGFEIPLIKDAIEAIRHLDPKPGARFLAESTHYVVPDIIVERTDAGEYEVRLADDWTPNIHISRRYIELYRDKAADPKAKEYLKRKITAATWLMDSIAQRRSTLERVTKAIIKHQRAFLDQGPDHIEPLKMQQIAEIVGVHVTTVSRAVDDKWVQTPRGVFPLKRFFGGGTKNEQTGEEIAWETIKQKLLEMIGNEDKSNPLSDEDIVTKLHEAGLPVARRTVTKYRKMLNIPSSRQRKDWA